MIPGRKKTSRLPHIPLDIVEKILLKLPVKSIIRYRSVCKTWCDLLDGSRFAALHIKETDCHRIVHYSFNRKELVSSGWNERSWGELVLYSEAIRPYSGLETTSVNSRSFKVNEQTRYGPWEFKLVGNCNGILCFTTAHKKVPYPQNFIKIFLINPSLNEMTNITTSGWELGYWRHLCGLGFDHISNNFKLVIMPITSRKKKRADVYNFSTSTWSRVPGIRMEMLPINDFSVFFNGGIHWCVDTKVSHCQMLTFNTTTDLFEVRNLPKEDRVLAKPSLLVLNQELLAFVAATDQFVDIWIMKEYGVDESWTKLYSIGTLENIIAPVSFWEKDKILLRTKDDKLVLYDMLQGRASESTDLSGNQPSDYPKSDDYCLGYTVCKESLISFRHLGVFTYIYTYIYTDVFDSIQQALRINS